MPQNSVESLAETQDGYVWVGTEAGLVRFDGYGFHSADAIFFGQKLQGHDVRSLLATPDGALWIGTEAGLARWQNLKLKVFTKSDGLPSAAILSLRSLNAGRMGVWTEQGAAILQAAGFAAAPQDEASATTALPLGYEAPNAALFHGESAQGFLYSGTRRTIDLKMKAGPKEQTESLTVGRQIPGSRLQVLLADREGSLWIGSNAGLVRWLNGKVEQFPLTDSLAAASILALMEDRAGNIWVGTEQHGLQILRNRRVQQLDERDGLSSVRVNTILEDGRGTLWAGTQGAGLDELVLKAGTWTRRRNDSTANGLASNIILSLAEGRNHELWVGTPDGLNRIQNGRVETYTSADGLPDDFIRSLFVDRDGSLWIGTRHGIGHWKNASSANNKAAQIEILTEASGLPSGLIGAVTRNSNGDLWIATFGGVATLRNGRVQHFTPQDGVLGSTITDLAALEHGLMAVGSQDQGWALGDENGLIDTDCFPKSMSVHSVLMDNAGGLWIATKEELLHCTGLQRGSKNARCASVAASSGAGAAIGQESATSGHPSAWRMRAGYLLFATAKGVLVVDPVREAKEPTAPPVVLEEFRVDDQPMKFNLADSPLRIEAGHVHFEFDYAGLNFAAPQQVRYRYRLLGFDQDWIDAGQRRTAYYTNIPPGRYGFKVQAAVNGGPWSDACLPLQFDLRPRFQQTWWFRAVLLAMLTALAWLGLRLRIRIMESRFRAVLDERNRIAREIHDTLAQGYAGLSVQLEVVSELLQQHRLEAATQFLNEARASTRTGLDEARRSIWALRTAKPALTEALQTLAATTQNRGLRVELITLGTERKLAAAVQQEVVRIAEESMQNTLKHANAGCVVLQLEFARRWVEVSIHDDGRGFDLAAMDSLQHTHYGLHGMRERAQLIAARLTVESAVGSGTLVSLRVPVEPDGWWAKIPRFGRSNAKVKKTGESS